MEHTPKSEKNKPTINRRNFLLGAAAAGGAALAGTKMCQSEAVTSADTRVSNESIEPADEVESVEAAYQNSEFFDAKVSGYYAQINARYDEVQFVDTAGAPVGEAVAFEEFVIDRERTTDDGQTEVQSYLLTPGPVNDIGMVTEGIAGEWLDYVKELQQQSYPDRQIAGQLNVQSDFKNALTLTEEVDLVAGIQEGRITRYIDIVNYFAEKPVAGAESMTRKEYVVSAMNFPEWDPERGVGLPPAVEAELLRLMPGLCAHESKFNAAVTSPAGAKGIFQFMPDTWEGYGKDLNTITSLREQVEVASAFFPDLYREVLHHLGEDVCDKVRSVFADETAFQRDFLVPCILSSYNAGSRRVGVGMQRFLEQHEVDTLPPGKDLFMQAISYMADSDEGVLDRYGKESNSYVPKVYANAQALPVEMS